MNTRLRTLFLDLWIASALDPAPESAFLGLPLKNRLWARFSARTSNTTFRNRNLCTALDSTRKSAFLGLPLQNRLWARFAVRTSNTTFPETKSTLRGPMWAESHLFDLFPGSQTHIHTSATRLHFHNLFIRDSTRFSQKLHPGGTNFYEKPASRPQYQFS